MNETPVTQVPRRIARSLIRSLADGTPVMEGIRYIHVGHTNWIDAQAELLRELAEDHDSDVLFVRGAYGAGKTHFLGCVQERAQEAGWATAHLECRRDKIELDRFDTVYPRILYKLRSHRMLQDAVEQGLDPAEMDGGRWFLDKWAALLLSRAGHGEGPVRRTMEVEERLYSLLQTSVLQRNLPGNFQRALCAYARATVVGNADLCNELVGWFRAEPRHVKIPAALLQRPGLGGRGPAAGRPAPPVDLPPITRAAGVEMLRGILWLIKQTGHQGLVLGVDELEEIAKLRPKRRQDQCFQTLREFVDNSDGDLGLRYLCTYFAATPEMFDSPDYFRRYDALSTRIEPVGEKINWRSPVIDLDRTPLSDREFRLLAHKIRETHHVAHSWDSRQTVTNVVLDRIVHAVLGARYRVAKPRLLCRVVVDELERARLAGPGYVPRSSHDAAVREAAERLQREHEA
jgi:hypothetical protein